MTEKAKKKRNEIIISVFNHTPAIDYEHITIKELCDISGISVGAFYHYFGDKAGFFSQVFAVVDDYILEKVSNNVTGTGFEQDLLNYASGFAQCAKEMGPRMFKSVYTSCPSFSDEEEKNRPLFLVPYHILQEAQEKGHLLEEQDIEESTKELLVILRGYVYDWSHREGKYDIVEQVKKITRIFIRGIRNE